MRFEFRNGSLSVAGTFDDSDTSTWFTAVTDLDINWSGRGAGGGGNGMGGGNVGIDEPLHNTRGFEIGIHRR